MTALRRDLIERKLWLMVALLAVAIAAVPILLLNSGGSAPAAHVPLPPPAAPTSAPAPGHVATVPVKTRVSHAARDPFASAGAPAGGSGKSTPSSSGTGAPAAGGSPAVSTATAAAPAPPAPSTTTAAMVSPAPTSSNASSSPGSGGSSIPATHPTSTVAGGTSHAPSAPVSTTASVDPAPVSKPMSWTTYSVSVRIGKDMSAPLRSDVVRLTPLPSVRRPAVLFTGVMSGGHEAAFSLQTGVQHTGPGLCRPSHTRCALIVLRAGQTEHLTIPGTAGKSQQLILRVTRIAGQVTHSFTTAEAAYRRFSAVGLCELALADPVIYDVLNGTVSTVASRLCKGHPNAVPFPAPAGSAPSGS